MSGLFSNLFASILFLIIYEIVKNIWYYFRNKKLKGTYIHCDNDFSPYGDKVNLDYSNSEIRICIWSPSVLRIKSKDVQSDGRIRIWEGEIKIDSDTQSFGHGTYKYKDTIDSGLHNIIVMDKDVICVQLFDVKGGGKTYLWVRNNSERIKKNQPQCS